MNISECLRIYILTGKTDRLLDCYSREDGKHSADACNWTGWSWRDHRQCGRRGLQALRSMWRVVQFKDLCTEARACLV